MIIRNEEPKDYRPLKLLPEKHFITSMSQVVPNITWSASCGSMKTLFQNWTL